MVSAGRGCVPAEGGNYITEAFRQLTSQGEGAGGEWLGFPSRPRVWACDVSASPHLHVRGANGSAQQLCVPALRTSVLTSPYRVVFPRVKVTLGGVTLGSLKLGGRLPPGSTTGLRLPSVFYLFARASADEHALRHCYYISLLPGTARPTRISPSWTSYPGTELTGYSTRTCT